MLSCTEVFSLRIAGFWSMEPHAAEENKLYNNSDRITKSII